MDALEILHHVNDGSSLEVRCANCGADLGSERAAARTRAGAKFFCRTPDGDDPTHSCYVNWQKRRVWRALMSNRCHECGGRFGLIVHRWFGQRFCSSKCRSSHLNRLARDRDQVARWFNFLTKESPRASP